MSITRLHLALGLGGLLCVAAFVPAQANESLRLDRGLVASGGGRSEGGEFRVQGTIGQFDAEPLQPSSGGAFAVTGGFWAGLSAAPAPPATALFEDGFEPR